MWLLLLKAKLFFGNGEQSLMQTRVTGLVGGG